MIQPLREATLLTWIGLHAGVGLKVISGGVARPFVLLLERKPIGHGITMKKYPLLIRYIHYIFFA
jgi:hypothetical protein